MWFDNEDVSVRQFARRHRRPTLNVRARVGKRGLPSRPAFVFLAVLLVAGAAFLIWFGVKLSGELLFSRNPIYTIARLKIDSDSVVVRDFIKGKRGIREGMNLFGFDIDEVREEFLKGAPSFRSMEIYRELPDTLSINVAERVPVAGIGRRGGFVVDRDGFVFGPKAGGESLALIIGYKGSDLKPGDRVRGLVRDAVMVLDVCRQTVIGREVLIAGIAVKGGYGGVDDSLRLYLAGKKTVDLWWRREASDGSLPPEDLRARLLYLRGVLRACRREGRPFPSPLDLTLESYRANTVGG